MGYDVCIEAAGTKVLDYHEDGSYQGAWYAYTANGFYAGSYGSCSGCDWRESERSKIGFCDLKEMEELIDKNIGEEILKAKPMTLDEVLAQMRGDYLNDLHAAEFWAWQAASKGAAS